MEKVNIIIGRFQPFTLGHLKCAQEAQKKLGVKTVLLVINTVKQDERHPFLTKQIDKILDKMCKEEPSLAGYVLVKNANIVDNIEILRESGYEPISWTCGTDRYDAYDTMVKKATYMKLVPNIWKKQFAFLREIIMDVKEDVGNQIRHMRSLYEYIEEALKD